MKERDATRTDAPSDHRHRMLVERVRLLEANLPNAAIGIVILLVGAGTLLHGALPRTFLWSWLAAQVLLLGLRIASVAWLRPSSGRGDVHARLLAGVAYGTLSGSLWGLLGYVGVSSPNPLANLVVIMMMTGLVGGATALISHLPQVYLPYVTSIALPAAAYLLFASGAPDEQHWIGVLLSLYLLFSLIAARGAGAAVRQSIELRFRNADLVSGLREAHGAADEQRRRAEVALERERQANLAKSRFLAAASHDLRQPLHSLRLHAATLQSQTRDTRHAPAVRMMSRSVHALDELFDAILDISKLDAGTLEPELAHVPLVPLLDRLVAEFAPLAAARGLSLWLDSPPVSVHTDAMLLERLLRNLLANAVRYTASGEVRVEVGDAADGRVTLRVIDTGPGIARADRSRVFEEFVQIGNPERDRSQGIGLGLSIVRRIVDLLELAIELGDTPGGGTTVTVRVPRGDVLPTSGLAATTFAVGEDDTRLSLTVLIIDDEEAVRVAMEAFLEEHDCLVLAVDSTDEAIRTLTETGCLPDAIVCDYRLRGDERGTDAVRRVREHCGSEVPAVLVTGDIGIDGLRDIRHSALQVLHKPCDPVRLLEVLSDTGDAGRGNRSRDYPTSMPGNHNDTAGT